MDIFVCCAIVSLKLLCQSYFQEQDDKDVVEKLLLKSLELLVDNLYYELMDRSSCMRVKKH